MSGAGISARVGKLVSDYLGLESPVLLSDELRALGADSLDGIEIGMACEDEFDIVIPDADISGWKTVGDIVSWLEGHGVI